MEQSANLQLPYIMPSQAQKHVTHNEAIRSLDAIVQLSVVDRDLAVAARSPDRRRPLSRRRRGVRVPGPARTEKLPRGRMAPGPS